MAEEWGVDGRAVRFGREKFPAVGEVFEGEFGFYGGFLKFLVLGMLLRNDAGPNGVREKIPIVHETLNLLETAAEKLVKVLPFFGGHGSHLGHEFSILSHQVRLYALRDFGMETSGGGLEGFRPRNYDGAYFRRGAVRGTEVAVHVDVVEVVSIEVSFAPGLAEVVEDGIALGEVEDEGDDDDEEQQGEEDLAHLAANQIL